MIIHGINHAENETIRPSIFLIYSDGWIFYSKMSSKMLIIFLTEKSMGQSKNAKTTGEL